MAVFVVPDRSVLGLVVLIDPHPGLDLDPVQDCLEVLFGNPSALLQHAVDTEPNDDLGGFRLKVDVRGTERQGVVDNGVDDFGSNVLALVNDLTRPGFERLAEVDQLLVDSGGQRVGNDDLPLREERGRRCHQPLAAGSIRGNHHLAVVLLG